VPYTGGTIGFADYDLLLRLAIAGGGSREKARNPHSLLWGGMASGGLGAAAPIMAFSLESPLDGSGGQAHEIESKEGFSPQLAAQTIEKDKAMSKLARKSHNVS